MRLYVDDIRSPKDDTWNICRTVLTAVRALDMFRTSIEEIALDHDISHQVIVGKMSRPYPCEETFEVVARHMALMRGEYIGWQPKITIHTSNPVGADAMLHILKDAGFLDIEVVRTAGANRLETIL